MGLHFNCLINYSFKKHFQCMHIIATLNIPKQTTASANKYNYSCTCMCPLNNITIVATSAVYGWRAKEVSGEGRIFHIILLMVRMRICDNRRPSEVW